jgi:DNA adenine methylase
MVKGSSNMTSSPSEKKTIPSIIKWTGSKRKQAGTILKHIPNHERYVEPFLGGGAVLFFHTTNALATDIYQPLIDFWRLVQLTPQDLIKNYQKQWSNLQKDLPDYYYIVRERFNKSKDPNDLNFLLRTCVNGIVRFNDKGEFNNSFHLSRKGMTPELFQKNVLAWSNKLKNVQFECCDYEVTLSKCKKDDFIYMDPPYVGSKNRYINDLDLQRLLANLDYLNKKSIKWALSFDGSRGSTDLSFDLPKDLYKRQILISNGHSAVHRVLNGPLEEVHESLYLNY